MDRLKAGLATLLRRFQPAPLATVVAPARPKLHDAPLDVLAAKLLFSHLRNRQQLLGPPPTAFGHLDQSQTELLVRAMIAASAASGRIDDAKERQLRGALSTFGLQPEAPDFIGYALARPAPLDALLADVRDAHVGSLFYAASLAAVDKHAEVNRAYLNYLAVRLNLPAEALTRMHSQYGYAC